MPHRSALALLALLALPSCLELPSLERPDAARPEGGIAPAFAVASHGVESFDGRSWDDAAIPRRPRITVRFAPPPDPGAPVYLIDGPIDDELATDLTASPLRASTTARLIPCDVEPSADRVTLTPLAPLAPGAKAVIAVGAWARSGTHRLGTPFYAALLVSTDSADGATATDAWPPDGSTGLSPEAPLFAVRFDGELDVGPGALSLVAGDGTSIAATVRPADCREIGWLGPRCAVLEPLAPLAAGAEHELRLGTLWDATGAPLPPFAARVTTGDDGGGEMPRLFAPPCALDEETTDVGCLLVDDRSLAVRIHGEEPLRVTLETNGGRTRTIFSRGEGTLGAAGFAPDTELNARFSAINASGAVRNQSFERATTEPLPELAIVEVRADPLGREPTQEYVEIENRGTEAVDLAGLFLSDSPTSEGDPLPPFLVPPGGRVLVVAEGFDPDDTADVPVPRGIAVARLVGSIGSGGLSSYGEPLYLRDSADPPHRLSAAPAMPVRAGSCLVRLVDDPRRGDAAAFAPATCTPGTP